MTTANTPSTGHPENGTSEAERLRDICRRLWPFVRYFALAGAHPDAIAAVADLAEALREPGDKARESAEMAQRGRELGRQEIAAELLDRLRKEGWHGKIGRRLMAELESSVLKATLSESSHAEVVGGLDGEASPV